MTLYDKTVKFVDDAFQGKQKRHFERAVYWMEKFYPKFTEAHRIAAYSHDIERGVMKERDRQYTNKDFIRQHEEDGARIMSEFLKKEGADDTTITKVAHLISRHEEGGDEEQNALKDADSVSYFETNAEIFVRERAKTDGYDKVKEKIDWMFDRISSPVAKEAARANYEKWSKELDGMKNNKTLKIIHKTPTPTPEAKALKEALEKLGIKVYEEVDTGYMHVDLAIPKAKINIEVDGIHHLTNPKQIIADLNRGYYSNKEGYNTMHIPNEMIRKHLNEISFALAEASKMREQQLHIHVE